MPKVLQKQVNSTADAKKYGESVYGIEKKQFPYMLCITNLLLHGLDIPRVYHDNSLLKDVLDYTTDDQFDVILMNPPYGGHEDKSIQGFFPDKKSCFRNAAKGVLLWKNYILGTAFFLCQY